MDFKALLLSPAGRVNREDFWVGFLILAAADVLVLLIPLVGWALMVASIYCWICLYSKRLHDMGKPAWLIAIPYGVWLIPVVAAIVMGGMAIVSGLVNGDDSGTSFSVLAGLGGFLTACLVALLIGLGFLLWMGLTPGQTGDNRYGSPVSAHPITRPASSEPPGEPPAT
ncbi:MAG TPA: DUF805 domain-containing protein [Caulobacteraceae bacterium]|jgi:uncharacterized membrane protein YhaH (DUF805 family)|nr:DUF805 domain-containing protein [Caulobacteraceae bacterium]